MKNLLIKWFGKEWYCRNFHSHVKDNNMWYCDECKLHLRIYASELHRISGGPR